MNETTNSNPPATACSCCATPSQPATPVTQPQPQTQATAQNPANAPKGKRNNNRKK